MAPTGHITDKAMIMVLFEEEDGEEDGVDEPSGTPDDDTVWTSKDMVCFWERDEDEALISTSTDSALSDCGVPEIVRVSES